jgi:CheY-like chemotaxis protein
VAVVSLDLPGIDGLAVAEKILRDWPGVAVVLLASDDCDDSLETCRSDGVAVIRKPPDPEAIARMVSSTLP